MRSCGASLMRMEGTANGDEYEEEGKFGVLGFFGREISRS
jgi:hypothetical protein